MSQRISIKHSGAIVDVFSGEDGFSQEDWTRFVLVKSQKVLKFVKGKTLSMDDMSFVKKELGL